MLWLKPPAPPGPGPTASPRTSPPCFFLPSASHLHKPTTFRVSTRRPSGLVGCSLRLTTPGLTPVGSRYGPSHPSIRTITGSLNGQAAVAQVEREDGCRSGFAQALLRKLGLSWRRRRDPSTQPAPNLLVYSIPPPVRPRIPHRRQSPSNSNSSSTFALLVRLWLDLNLMMASCAVLALPPCQVPAVSRVGS
ncbi:hypothetical protein BDV06DRAFT_72269 [Aspergillus oleicola]